MFEEAVLNVVSRYMKSKTGNAKAKIQNVETKKMTDVSQKKQRKSQKNETGHPPVSEMVMESIKALRKRNGASYEDIAKYIEEKYVVNVKRLKGHINTFLRKSLVAEKLERIVEVRYKVKTAATKKTN